MATRDEIMRALLARLGRHDLVENRWRGEVVEVMLAPYLLEHGWTSAGMDWNSWDFEHKGLDLRLQVKQSAAWQTWGLTQRPSFGIGKISRYYDGTKNRDFGEVSDDKGGTKTKKQRVSEVYVFAFHPDATPNANHWNENDWLFWVVAESELSKRYGDQLTIGLDEMTRCGGKGRPIGDVACAVKYLCQTQRPEPLIKPRL